MVLLPTHESQDLGHCELVGNNQPECQRNLLCSGEKKMDKARQKRSAHALRNLPSFRLNTSNSVYFTDASETRIGIVNTARHTWFSCKIQGELEAMPIAYKELLAVYHCLSTAKTRQQVTIFTDNTVVLAVLRKLRSTHPNMESHARRIRRIVFRKKLTILPLYVPTNCNPADIPSRLPDDAKIERGTFESTWTPVCLGDSLRRGALAGSALLRWITSRLRRLWYWTEGRRNLCGFLRGELLQFNQVITFKEINETMITPIHKILPMLVPEVASLPKISPHIIKTAGDNQGCWDGVFSGFNSGSNPTRPRPPWPPDPAQGRDHLTYLASGISSCFLSLF